TSSTRIASISSPARIRRRGSLASAAVTSFWRAAASGTHPCQAKNRRSHRQLRPQGGERIARDKPATPNPFASLGAGQKRRSKSLARRARYLRQVFNPLKLRLIMPPPVETVRRQRGRSALLRALEFDLACNLKLTYCLHI